MNKLAKRAQIKKVASDSVSSGSSNYVSPFSFVDLTQNSDVLNRIALDSKGKSLSKGESRANHSF